MLVVALLSTPLFYAEFAEASPVVRHSELVAADELLLTALLLLYAWFELVE